MNFKGKKVLVLGLGLHGGGIGVVKFLAKERARITVTDLRTKKELAPSLKQLKKIPGIKYVLGRHDEKDVLGADLILKNPGIPFESPYLALARKNKIPITTDIGIFFNRCPGKIIGITGTRGKSTTAYLIWKFLQAGGKRAFIGGNIRKSVLEFLGKLKTSDYVVLELSSFQLQDLDWEKKSPHVAVFTNLMRDHLNRHKDLKEYAGAKSVIFKYQQRSDFIFANPEDTKVIALVKKAKSKKIFPQLPEKYFKTVKENLGEHYVSSAGLAAAVAERFKIPDRTIQRVLLNFHGLDSRQEEVAKIRNVHFVNDTTSTVPDATIEAIRRFRKKAEPGRKIILIAGGQNKNLKFDKMAKFLQEADRLLFFPGSATDAIISLLKKTGKRFKKVFSMSEAVKEAWSKAGPGDWIILSPGATSFGLFLNEFDRGAKFLAEVEKLKKKYAGKN